MFPPNSSISNFKLFATRIIIPTLLLVVLAGWLFQIFFERKIILHREICGDYKVNRIINQTNPNEIPILGASMAQGNFIPDTLGSNYFNYGLDGTGGNVLLFFMKEECKKKKNNPYLIVTFTLNGLIYSLGDISIYLYNAQYPDVRHLLGKKYQTYFGIPVVKYFGQYETYMKYYLNDRINLTKYTDKGASIEKNKMTKDRFDQLIKERENTIDCFKNDTSLEQEFLSIINSNQNRIFIIIISPYHKSYFAQFQNYAGAEQFINKLRTYKNVRVYDFANSNYPDSMFMNTTHLNYYGAVRFSKELKDSLKAINN